MVVVSIALGQSSTERAFDVASVKPSASGAGVWSVVRGKDGRFVAENTPLKALIEFAYDIRDPQIIGAPGWMGGARYNIEARPDRTIPVGPVGDATTRLMLRDLLSDRFHLVTHRETVISPVYALVVGKNGPKLTEATPESKGPDVWVSRGQFRASKVTMTDVAHMLSTQVGRTVIDKTGLTGTYNFILEYAPEVETTIAAKEGVSETAKSDSALTPEAPAIFTALQEQLGLRLESTNGPVEILVVDRVERPSPN